MNAISLDCFSKVVAELKTGLSREYDRGVNRDLSQQRHQQVFKRNITKVLQAIYRQALTELQRLTFEDENQGDEKIREQELGPELLRCFDGVIEEIILYALHKHRSSCALSNFPDEHNPSPDYIAQVIEETSRDWAAFVRQVNMTVVN